MSNGVQVYMEYPIKGAFLHQYEATMENVHQCMRELGVEKIEWYASPHYHNRYIEVFYVPTESHFFALKKLRTYPRQELFGKLMECIDGGPSSIHYIALKKCS
ncbi:hypothetical protein LCL95_16630 [Bacillus timonensis]|nr:hypothetical protein [Bacillus timonensis]